MKLTVFIYLFLLSCSDSPDPRERPALSPPKGDSPILRAHKPLKDNFPKGLPPVKKFPGRDYQKVIAYQLSGRSSVLDAAVVFKEQTGKKAELTEAKTAEFLNLINNPKNYGHAEYLCFHPRIGLVFYGTDNQPVAYLSLCLECNNMYAEPPLELGLERPLRTGFGKKMHRRLGEIFEKWGLASSNHDDTTKHDANL